MGIFMIYTLNGRSVGKWSTLGSWTNKDYAMKMFRKFSKQMPTYQFELKEVALVVTEKTVITTVLKTEKYGKKNTTKRTSKVCRSKNSGN